MRRLLFWSVAFCLVIAGASADPVPDGVHLNWRFNTSAGVEAGTWNVTFNLSRNPNCSDVIYSSTRNLSSTSAGDLDVYLYGEAANFTPATHLCLWRNQSFLYGIFNLTRLPRNVSPSQVMDDAPLNLTNVSATNLTADFFSTNTSFMVAGRIQSWFAPLTDASLDLGNTSLRFRDLYVSRNLTDGTAFVTIQNMSDAANVTQDYARINATLGTNTSSLTNNSPINLTPYNVTARHIVIENDTSLQSVMWFSTFGVNRGSWFWDNKTDRYALGTYTETGAWNGYAWWLNATTKTMRVYGELVTGKNITANTTIYAPNASFTALEGNLSCSNVTGAASNLCTITDTDTNTITDPAGLYQNASNSLTANWATGNFSLAQNSLRVNATGNPDPFNVTANESSLILHPNGTLTLAVNTTLVNHSQTLRTDDSHGLLVETASGTDLFRIDTVSALIYSRTFRPTSSAAYTLGQSGFYWLDLFLSRNLTDGTYWGSVQNLSEAAWYTLNATRAGLLLNASGTHNVSVSQLAALANTSRTLLNSSQESDYVNRTGGNMTGPLNMTGNPIGNVSNITLGPHMLTWNQSCIILLTNGTGQDNYCV